MKPRTLINMGFVYYFTCTFIFVISALIERFNPGSSGFVKYAHLDPRIQFYIAFILTFYGWAMIEGKHDAVKINNHHRIDHTTSMIARVVMGGLFLWFFQAHEIFSWKELLSICVVAVGGFSFIFTLRLNLIRGVGPDYFSKRPNPYDSIYTPFPDPGKTKFITEMILFVISFYLPFTF